MAKRELFWETLGETKRNDISIQGHSYHQYVNTHGLCMVLGPISPWLIPILTLIEKVMIFTGYSIPFNLAVNLGAVVSGGALVQSHSVSKSQDEARAAAWEWPEQTFLHKQF